VIDVRTSGNIEDITDDKIGYNGFDNPEYGVRPMEQIIILVRNKEKAAALLSRLRSLDYISSVAVESIDIPADVYQDDFDRMEAFQSMAGIWENRDISQKSLREKAWPMSIS
jgi:hypothetical protein